jgi:predicted metal-dependent phosphoesterase TrpH
MIEAAIRKGLNGLIITDHDSVKGGLVGKEVARDYRDFKVIPGAEITSRAGHVLAIGVDENVQKGLGVEETVGLIHDLGGIAVASHPFSIRVRPSVGNECLKADAVEVFNATSRGLTNSRAMSLAKINGHPRTAGSDAHWARTVGTAGIICDDPVENIPRGKVELFGTYVSTWDLKAFNFRQLASALPNRPLWK